MKNYIQYLTIGALLMGSLTSCNDFLDREPLDKVTPEKFFSAEADLAAYAINNYKFVTVDDKYGINLFGKDNDTDNQASGTSNSFWIPGEKKVAADRGEWKWEDIRSCNYFFDQVLPRYEEGAITGNQDNVKHYIGEMYVNRAYSYFQLFTKFGDLPIVTTALPDIQGELVEASKRQPRHKVARFIIEDLKKAEDMLLNSIQNPGQSNPLSLLTDREKEIAELYAQGLGNLEIANHLNLKQNTVSTMKKRVLEKLELKTTLELIDFLRREIMI